jgi:hypothetical protein
MEQDRMLLGRVEDNGSPVRTVRQEGDRRSLKRNPE